MERGADVALATAVAHTVNQPYSDVVDGTFERIDACGASGEDSCIDVGGVTYVISYNVEVVDDADSSTQIKEENFVALTLHESASGAERRVVVAPPNAGYAAGWKVVRARFVGDGDIPTTQDLYLLTEDGLGGVEVVDGPERFDSAGYAYFRVENDGGESEACVAENPCYVGLQASAQWWRSGEPSTTNEWGIGGAAFAEGITVAPNSLTEAAVDLYRGTSLQVMLRAESWQNELVDATAPGSICIWASFIDGGERRDVPLCNTEDPAHIDFSTYAVNGEEYLTPTGRPITMSVDHPSGACVPVEGQMGHTADGWRTRSVCTSWTWGYPTKWGPTGGSKVALDSAEFSFTANPGGSYQQDLIWSNFFGAALDRAIPASGYTGESQWVRPREAPGCSVDSTCVAIGWEATPERDTCPGRHCFSIANAAPEGFVDETDPRVTKTGPNLYGVEVSAGDPMTIEVGANDADGDRVELEITSVPDTGTLYFEDEEIEVGTESAVIFTDEPAGHTAQLRYDTSVTDSSASSPFFTFVVRDNSGAENSESETVVVNLGLNDSPATIIPHPIGSQPLQVIQGAEDVEISVRVFDGAGNPVGAGVPVAFQTTADGIVINGGGVAQTNSSGVATITADFPTAPQGRHVILAQHGGIVGQYEVEVRATLDRIETTPSSVAQGSGGGVGYVAYDAYDQGMEGVIVEFETTGDVTFTRTGTAYGVDGEAHGANVPRYRPGQAGNALVIESGTVNLLSSSDASFETGAGSWATFADNTLSPTTEESWHGEQALVATYVDDVRLAERSTTLDSAGVYTVSARVKVEAGYDGGALRLGHDGTFTGATDIATVATDADRLGEWQTISYTFEADAGDLAGSIVLSAETEPSAGTEVLIDGVQLEKKAFASSWIPGGSSRNGEKASANIGEWLPAGAGTIDIWVDVNDGVRSGDGDVYVLAGTTGAGANQIVLRRSSGGQWQAVTSDANGDASTVTVADTLPSGWHLFTLRWDADELALFIDGEKASSTADPNIPQVTPTDLFLGSWVDGSGVVNSAIDDLRIAATARQDADIAAAADAGYFTPSHLADPDTLLLARFDVGSLPESGLTFAPSCVTSGSGACQIAVAAESSAKAGVYPVVATSGDFTTLGRLEVEAVPASLELAHSISVPQGQAGTFGVKVVDRAGAPTYGAAVSFTESSSIFDIAESPVETDLHGVAHYTVVSPAGSPTGSDVLTVIAAGVSAEEVTVNIVSAADSVVADEVWLYPLGLEEFIVTVYDASGEPLAGVEVVATSQQEGISIGPWPAVDEEDEEADPPLTDSGFTDNTGQIVFQAGAGDAIAPGFYEDAILIEVEGGISAYTDVDLVQVPFSIEATESPFTVDQGGNVEVSFTALDNVGNPIPNFTFELSIGSSDGIDLPAEVTTDVDGVAAFTLEVDSNVQAGSTFIGVLGGWVDDIIEVDIHQVFSHLEAVHNPFGAEPTKNNLLEVLALDLAGNPMAGIPVTWSAGGEADIDIDPLVVNLGAVSWWPLDDAGSPLANLIDEEAEATAQGGWQFGTEVAPYHNGTGVSSSGNDRLDLGVDLSDFEVVIPGEEEEPDFSSTSFTLAMWVKGDTNPPGNYLFGNDTGSGDQLFARIGSSGALELGVGEAVLDTGWNPGSNFTHHLAVSVVATDAGGAVVLYVDGVEEFRYEDTPPEDGEPGTLTITGLPAGNLILGHNSSGWQGGFADVALWAKVASAEEIATVYQWETSPDGDVQNTSLVDGVARVNVRPSSEAVGSYPITVTGPDDESIEIDVEIGVVPSVLRLLGENAVSNGTFEVDDSGWLGGDWDSAEAYSGVGSLRRDVTAGVTSLEAVTVDGAEGGRLAVNPASLPVIRAKVLTDTPGLWVNLRGRYLDASGTPIGGADFLAKSGPVSNNGTNQTAGHFRDTSFVPNGAWAEYEVVATDTPPVGAAWLEVEAFTEADVDGSFWIDEVYLYDATAPAYTVSQGESVDVIAELLDQSGAPMEGAELTFTVDGGAAWQLQTATTGADGMALNALDIDVEAVEGTMTASVEYGPVEAQIELLVVAQRSPGLRVTYSELDGNATNVATADGVIVSSSNGDAFGVYDGRVSGTESEAWRAAGQTGWVTFELPEETQLTHVVLHDLVDPGLNVTAGSVQTSTDGFAWENTVEFGALNPDGKGDVIPFPYSTKHVRVNITASEGSYGGFSEIKLLAADEVESLVGENTRVVASSEFDTQHSASNVIDGITGPGSGGSWISLGENIGAWVQVDLGADAWISEISAWGRQSGAATAEEVAVEISNDGIAWRPAGVLFPSENPGEASASRLPTPQRGRYLRWTITAGAGANNGLAEVDVVGSWARPEPGDGTPFATGVIDAVDWDGSEATVYGSGRTGNVAVEASGVLEITSGGEYVFAVDGAEDARVSIDGNEVFSYARPDGGDWDTDTQILADVTGDGLDDLVVRERASGEVWVAVSDGERFVSFEAWGSAPGGDWEPLAADFDGDGLADVAWRNQESSEWTLLTSTGSGFDESPFGTFTRSYYTNNGGAAVAQAPDISSLELSGDFSIDIDARADWNTHTGRVALVEKWDEAAGDRSIRFGVAESGRLELAVSTDGENVTEFVSTESIRNVLDDGEPAQLSVEVTAGTPAQVAFYVNGEALGEAVESGSLTGAYHDHGSGWVVGTLSDDGRDRIEFTRVVLYGDAARSSAVADWNFAAEEGGATTIPNSAGSGAITITGGAVSEQALQPRAGTSSFTQYTAGDEAQYASITGSGASQVSGDFALEFVGASDWKSRSAGAPQTLISKWQPDSNEYELVRDSDGRLALYLPYSKLADNTDVAHRIASATPFPVAEALAFDGSESIEGDLPAIAGDTEHTVAAWVYVAEAPSVRSGVLTLGPQSNGGAHWLLTSSGKLQLGRWSGPTSDTVDYPLGEWFHLATTYDGSDYRVYVDGELVDTVEIDTPFTLDGSLVVGEGVPAEENFKGSLDEVGFWAEALSADEVAELAEKRTAPLGWVVENTSAVAYYPMNGGGEDLIANQDLTVGGSSTTGAVGLGDGDTARITVTFDDRTESGEAKVKFAVNGESLGPAHIFGGYGVVDTRSYRDMVLADEPIAYWTFEDDEGTGVFADVSGNGHDATATGQVVYSSAGIGDTESGSVAFGDEGYLDVTGLPVNDAPGAKTTVEAWVWWEKGVAANQMPFGFTRYDVYLTEDSGVGFNTGAGDVWGPGESANTEIVGKWTHVVAEFTNGDPTQNRLWLDGAEVPVLQQGGNYNATHAVVTSDFRMSSWAYSTDYTLDGGRIDEVAIFDGTLDEADILNRFRAGSQRYEDSIIPDAPLAYWALDGRTGTDDLAGDADLTPRGGMDVATSTNVAVRGQSKAGGTTTQFDGSDDYLSTQDDALSQTENLTLEAWIRPLGTGSVQDIITKMGGEFALSQTADGKLLFSHGEGVVEGSYTWASISERPLRIGAWQHIAVVRDADASEIRWYLDGEEIGVSTYTEEPSVADLGELQGLTRGETIVVTASEDTKYFYTYQHPGLAAVRAICQGGGGAGGGRHSSYYTASGGGGGGGYAETWIDADDLPSIVQLTAGEGGTGISGSSGNPGQDSYVTPYPSGSGDDYCRGGGGGGGAMATATTLSSGSPATATGGAGGSGVGDIVIPGQRGGTGRMNDTSNYHTGNGGDSHLGHGGWGVFWGTGVSSAGTGFGGGSSGIAGRKQANAAAASGSGGVVILELWYDPNYDPDEILGYTYGETLIFTSGSSTFTKADYPGLAAVKVVCQGGGGGGAGGVAGQYSVGTGGGGGGYAESWVDVDDLGATENIVVGAGGSSTGASNGSGGGQTRFGSHCVGNGGSGGQLDSSTSADTTLYSGGGAGGNASGNLIAIPGQPGERARRVESMFHYGSGGDSYMGHGGPGHLGATANANPGFGYGAGGSGQASDNTGTSRAGGAGTGGIVMVELWYDPNHDPDNIPGYTFGEPLTYTSNSTFNKKDYPGLAMVHAACQGGGGAGGGRTQDLAGSVGGGGGGGGYAEAWVPAEDLAGSESITVGAGGTGVAAANGNAGGNSSFGTHCVGNGGGGGQTGQDWVGAGGGGLGTGDLVIRGQHGQRGRRFSSIWANGFGGDSFLGTGGQNYPYATGNQQPGQVRGGGGTGQAGTPSSMAGGAGAGGIVLLETWLEPKPPADLRIGSGWTGPWYGRMGHVAIYDRALTQDEIRSHFLAGGRHQKSLERDAVLYLPLTDGPGATTAVHQGTGALSGTATYSNVNTAAAPITDKFEGAGAYFNGTNAYVDVPQGDHQLGGPWSERTFGVTFRTGDDVDTRQFIYKQGGLSHGLNMYIEAGEVYMVWWGDDGGSWTTALSAPVKTHSTYTVYSTMNANNDTATLWVNGERVDVASGVGVQGSHTGHAVVGASRSNSRLADGTNLPGGYADFFEGWIANITLWDEDYSEGDAWVIRRNSHGAQTGYDAHRPRWQSVANGDFESGLIGWTNAAGVDVRTTTDSYSGDNALQIIVTSEGTNPDRVGAYGIAQTMETPRDSRWQEDTPVAATGAFYQVKAWVKAEGTDWVTLSFDNQVHSTRVVPGEWTPVATPVWAYSGEPAPRLAIAPGKQGEVGALAGSTLVVDRFEVVWLGVAAGSFETDVTGYREVDTGGAVSWDNTNPHSGDHSLAITITGGEADTHSVYIGGDETDLPVLVQGETYTLEFWARSDDGVHGQVAVRQRDSDGVVESYPSATFEATPQWQRHSHTFQAESSGMWTDLFFGASPAGPAGTIHYDSVRLLVQEEPFEPGDAPIVVGAEVLEGAVQPSTFDGRVDSIRIWDDVADAGWAGIDLVGVWDFTAGQPGASSVSGWVAGAEDADLVANVSGVEHSGGGRLGGSIGSWGEVAYVAGDYDGDGDADIAAVDSARGGNVTVLNAASGTNTEWAGRYLTDLGEVAHRSGDLNGDGVSDIVTWQPVGGQVRALLSEGDSFTVEDGGAGLSGSTVAYALVGDFNGDGNSDLAIWDVVSGDVNVKLRSSGGDAWQSAAVWHNAAETGPTQLIVGDFNGDGRDDVARIQDIGNEEVWVSTGSGFTATEWVAAGEGATAVAGDLDGDGTSDLAAHHDDMWAGLISQGTNFAEEVWLNVDDETVGVFSCGLAAGYGNTIDGEGCVAVELEAGVHPITVWGRTFDRPGALRLAYAGPDTGGMLQVVPADALSHYTPMPLVEENFIFDAPGDDNTNLNGEELVLRNISATRAVGNITIWAEGLGVVASDVPVDVPGGETLTIRSGNGVNSGTEVYLSQAQEVWPQDGGLVVIDWSTDNQAGRLLRAAYGNRSIRIGDVIPNAPGDDEANPEGEVVEIVNESNTPWDLNGWELVNAEDEAYTFSSLTIPAWGSITVRGGSGTDSSQEVYVGGGAWLDDTGGRVTLTDGSRVVDTYRWGTGTPAAGEINTPPVIAPISDAITTEHIAVAVGVSATDADGDDVTLSAPGLPEFGDFTDHGDGTGSFLFAPGDGDAGVYEITVIATDPYSGTDEETFEITVDPHVPTNLITNGSLETGSYAPGSAGTAAGLFEANNGVSWDGSWRLRFLSSGSSGGTFAWNGASDDTGAHPTALPGQIHKVIVYAAKGSGTSDREVYVTVDYRDAGGNLLATHQSTPTVITASTGGTWQELTVTSDPAPANTAYVVSRLHVPAGGGPNLVFDAAELTLVGSVPPESP